MYGESQDKETELIIDIRKSNKEFHVLQNSSELDEPKELSPESYEMIVFKNKFESYRSENYGKGNGGWRE